MPRNAAPKRERHVWFTQKLHEHRAVADECSLGEPEWVTFEFRPGQLVLVSNVPDFVTQAGDESRVVHDGEMVFFAVDERLGITGSGVNPFTTDRFNDRHDVQEPVVSSLRH
jgi:hypothetical protein